MRRARWCVLALVAAGACLAPGAAPAAAAPVVAAAGDIACDTSSDFFNDGFGIEGRCRQKATSDLLVGAGLSAVLPLGDLQYHVGSLSDFLGSFHPSWGRVKEVIHPVPGNHEYGTTDARGYFDYFNGPGQGHGRAGDREKGYYSFDVGSWHLVALNSVCDELEKGAAKDGCAEGSPQERWLRSDLATHRSSCTLAYWHDPMFNSGHRGNSSATRAFWDALYAAGADIVLNGDAHSYERFAPQDPDGRLDRARGIREFVVGTGGAFFTGWSKLKPNSEIRQNSTFGVLMLTLHPGSYEWRFVPEAGKTFTDSGSGVCHGRKPAPAPATTPARPSPAAAAAAAISALKLTPSKFRSARSGASFVRERRRRPFGTTVTYSLSAAASVAFRVQRAKKGRKRGGRCRKPGRRATGKRCTRFVNVRGGFNLAGTAGKNRFTFTGRIRKHRLARGRYRLVATPRAAGKRGNTVRKSFRVR